MGILVEKDEDRSKLQQRIEADLRERASRTSKNDGGDDGDDDVDLEEDSALIEGTHKSRGTAIFWITLTVLALIALGIIFFLK
jgi:hypothetical protein